MFLSRSTVKTVFFLQLEKKILTFIFANVPDLNYDIKLSKKQTLKSVSDTLQGN